MKQKLIIVISLPRSGTNYFFDNIQKCDKYDIASYYEVFNDSFYNKSGCWDNFYEKYSASSKLDVLDKLLKYGNGLQKKLDYQPNNHENKINIIKIFPNHISKKEFIQLLGNNEYDIRVLFLIRNVDDVHQSYYHAQTTNDWTRCRNTKLQKTDICKMLENIEFKKIYEEKTFDCYKHDMLNIVKYYKKEYRMLYFDDYKNYQKSEFEEMISGLFFNT